MAELLLKVGSVSSDPAHYQDGDIICAFSDRRIKDVHAEHICHVRHAGFTRDGLRETGTLAQRRMELTRQWRFVRVSASEVRRDDLRGGGPSEVFGPGSMSVGLYLRRRLAHPTHRVFGSPGREVWYGGRTYTGHADLDALWSEIEARTPLRLADHRLWPLSETEKRHFLGVTVDDMTDEEASAYQRTDVEEVDPDEPNPPSPRVLRRRTAQVPWRDILSGSTVQDADDRTKAVDNRETATPLVRAVVVASR